MSERKSSIDNTPAAMGSMSGETTLRFLLSVFHSSPNAVSISDLEGNLRLVNSRALQLFGHTDDSDVIGRSIFAWVSPEDHTVAREALQQLTTEGRVTQQRLQLRRRDGSTFSGEVRSTLVRSTIGGPTYLLFSVEDRTAQHQYESALQAILKGTSASVGGSFFHSFIRELSGILGMRYAFVGRALEGSPARIRTQALCIDGEVRDSLTFDLSGTPCEVEGEDGLAFFPQGVRERFPAAGFLRDWTAEAYLGVTLRSTGGHFKGILAVIHDQPVHDTTLARSIIGIFAARAAAEIGRLEADEGLWENELRLRSIIDHAPFGAHMYELSGDGRLIFAGHNQSADRILGVDHHHLVGMTIEEAWPPLAATQIPEAYRRVARGDGAYGENGIQYEADGVNGTFEINAFQTGPNRMAVFFRDVTERKAAEAALRAAKEKAESADRAKTALLGNLSHEFRTPITGILGMADLLRARAVDRDAGEAINAIVDSAHRLHQSLDAILKLGQLASGMVTPAMRDIDVRTNVERVVDSFRHAAATKGLELRVEHQDRAATAHCDSQMLDDILRYLLDNAFKYTKTGSIVVRTSMMRLQGSDWCSLEVQDTGIGVAPEHYETIFEEFKQVSEGYGREYEGSGLGLTLARRMTVLLGGSLSVTSHQGTGSTFTLRLPSAQAPVAAGTVSPDRARKVGTAPVHPGLPRVLIVEDNFINKTVIAEFLKHMCSTDHARDGKTAIQMVRDQSYDAVLMDINLGPGLNGIETTKIIRGIQGYKDTPIVAVTGYTLPGDRERLLAEGLNGYIPKPFGREDIQNSLREFLRR